MEHLYSTSWISSPDWTFSKAGNEVAWALGQAGAGAVHAAPGDLPSARVLCVRRLNKDGQLSPFLFTLSNGQRQPQLPVWTVIILFIPVATAKRTEACMPR